MQLEPTEIAAGGLLLRPWRADDAPAIDTAFHDPHVLAWLPARAERNFADGGAVGWIERRSAETVAGTGIAFGVTEGGVVVGCVTLTGIDDVELACEIGYWILPAHRRRGLAARTVAVATDWALTGPALRRVTLGHVAANEASCRIADRCGYRFEGTLRDAFRRAPGEPFHDVHVHSRLAADKIHES